MPQDVIHGGLYWVPQDAVYFGSNASIPRERRPAMIVARVGPFIPVLPSTSDDMRGDADFFHVPGTFEYVEFVEKRARYSDFFLTCYAESVTRATLQERIGQIREHVRYAISKWLISLPLTEQTRLGDETRELEVGEYKPRSRGADKAADV